MHSPEAAQLPIAGEAAVTEAAVVPLGLDCRSAVLPRDYRWYFIIQRLCRQLSCSRRQG